MDSPDQVDRALASENARYSRDDNRWYRLLTKKEFRLLEKNKEVGQWSPAYHWPLEGLPIQQKDNQGIN